MYIECLAGSFEDPADVMCPLPVLGPPENATDQTWPHWWKLNGALRNTPSPQRRGCFFPFRRVSRRALELVSQELGKSWG